MPRKKIKKNPRQDATNNGNSKKAISGVHFKVSPVKDNEEKGGREKGRKDGRSEK